MRLWPRCYLRHFNKLFDSIGWTDHILPAFRIIAEGETPDPHVALYIRVSHRLTESQRNKVWEQFERWMKRNYPELRTDNSQIIMRVGIVT